MIFANVAAKEHYDRCQLGLCRLRCENTVPGVSSSTVFVSVNHVLFLRRNKWNGMEWNIEVGLCLRRSKLTAPGLMIGLTAWLLKTCSYGLADTVT